MQRKFAQKRSFFAGCSAPCCGCYDGSSPALRRWPSAACRSETPLLAPFIYKCIILPRQARDKHRENSKKEWRFAQWLALTERLISYLPALGVSCLCVTVWRTQRETRRLYALAEEGEAAAPTTSTTTASAGGGGRGNKHCIDYWHREPGLRKKIDNLQANIETMDGVVERLVMCLLKLHSAFAVSAAVMTLLVLVLVLVVLLLLLLLLLLR
jgi:hypothetical protein